MSSLLVCSALGPHSPEVVPEFARLATECQCTIIDMRVSVLGRDIVLGILLTGHWNALAKFEMQSATLANRLELVFNTRRTQATQLPDASLPYSVQIFSSDNVNLISDVTSFFVQQGVAIQELFANTYQAHQTGGTVSVLNLAIAIPASTHLNALRDQFQMLCDECNLDGIMEPIKS
ncbi:glycine cleavage system protein R [Permianibacter aggregans]|uniref:Glycine cleavage system transcriptional repressor n=1 Tax=Permianibacter aggregans TaxID=1510150 RepID=A0A4R6UYU3_9GAMM|nr:ACT domain-containing protein [Permianibacter aggregans]QGX41486.1 hypothetical protein E2H98_18145 [Permianibacter aggregans]TDQ51279.1 glycine cleavage system transcriptional repressor [Permianibacter aggregans]